MSVPTTLWAAALVLSATLAQSAFVGGGADPYNVFRNTCNRFQHQAVLKNNSIWMDGGVNTFVNYTTYNPYPRNITGNETVGQNLWSIQVPMDQSWDWQTNISETAYSKSSQAYLPGVSSNKKPPLVNNAALWQGPTGDSRVWLFGGITAWWNIYWANFTYPASSTYTLWSMDSQTHAWTPYNISDQVPQRPNDGFAAEAPEKGFAYWINGFLGSGSATATQDFGDDVKQFQNGILVFDLNGQTPIVHNISSISNPWGNPRVSGQLEYVPVYGHDGILVMFGGGSKSATNYDRDDTGDYVDMSEIWVWDLNRWNTSNTNSAWYKQAAVGDVPGPRADSCSVGYAAPDNSSYQIYVHGGRYGNSFYDDLYVLSIPQFKWTRAYEDVDYKFGHTCHKAAGNQILRTGGVGTWQIPSNASCQNETRAVGVLNIQDVNSGWQTTYNQTTAPYRIPQYVTTAIGGNSTGGLGAEAPAAGWASDELRRVFAREIIAEKSSGLSGGAIAGIVVGVVVAVAILFALVLFLVIRRRRAQRRSAAAPTGLAQAQELGGGSRERLPTADSGQYAVEKDAADAYRYEKDATNGTADAKVATAPVTEMPAAEHEIRYEMDGSGTK